MNGWIVYEKLLNCYFIMTKKLEEKIDQLLKNFGNMKHRITYLRCISSKTTNKCSERTNWW